MPACASTTGRSGHSRASGSTWLGLANGCPTPVCTITGTPSLAASANTIRPSADDGSTACPSVCSFSATKPSPDTQRSTSAAYAAWSRCGLRLTMPRTRPPLARVMAAIRSCTAAGSRAPGNGITSARSRPCRSTASSTASSATSASKMRQSPRSWCGMLDTMDSPSSAGRDDRRSGRSPARVSLFVNGTLMRGEPLHGNLAGTRFIGPARTAPRYRLLSVGGLHPAMIPAGTGPAAAVSGELYELDLAQLQRVLEHEPAGLGLGVVELEDGSRTLGILWTAQDMPESAADISSYGGWREYRSARPRANARLPAPPEQQAENQ